MELLISILIGAGLIGYASSEADDAEEEYTNALNTLQDQLTNQGVATDGDDIVTLTNNADTFDAGPGHDIVNGRAGFDNISGGTGQDILIGDFGKDLLEGNGGDDILLGGEWDDGLFGGTQNDELYGGAGRDMLAGGAGDDQLHGGVHDDLLMGADGADSLFGEEGDDVLEGGGIFNRELNTGDYDVLRNLASNEDLDANRLSNFRLTRSDDGTADTLSGGDGNDMLILGDNDTGTGGPGTDQFAIGDWISSTSPATITDYQDGEPIWVFIEGFDGTTTPNIQVVVGPSGSAEIYLDTMLIANVQGAVSNISVSAATYDSMTA